MNTDFHTIKKIYNIDFENINYNNNKEYRDVFRNLFYQSKTIHDTLPDDSDEEYYDENDYHSENVNNALDILYDITKKNSLFQELYNLASAIMFSTDELIGQAVLLSYDNLPLFHKCLVSYLNDPKSFDEKNEYYLSLKKKLI